MLGPSITIRLDFGDGMSSGISHDISLQHEVPTPMGAGLGAAGVTNTELPTPFASSMAIAAQGSASASGVGGMSAAMSAPPEPSLGVGGMSAAMSAPPEPSLGIEDTGASGMPDDMPQPESEPEDVARPPRRRR